MAANFYYNCLNEECKRPFGALRAGHELSLTVFSRDGVFIDRVVVVLTSDADGSKTEYPMIFKGKEDGVSRYDVTFRVGSGGLYFYHFRLETEWGEEERFADENETPWQLTVFSSSYKTPDKFKGGLVYQIFVDRFNKGKDAGAMFDKKDGVMKEWNEPLTVCDPDGAYRANDFYGGNLQGIIDKLPYLKQLGVTLIYLTPIFRSSSNHRYDTGDYMKIDELVGGEDKLKELIQKAADKGMGIVLDGVFNHTGADSKYFNKFGNYPTVGAYQSEKSPYHNCSPTNTAAGGASPCPPRSISRRLLCAALCCTRTALSASGRIWALPAGALTWWTSWKKNTSALCAAPSSKKTRKS